MSFVEEAILFTAAREKEAQKKKEYHQKYRASHKEQIYRKIRIWRKANPEAVRATKKRYREKRKKPES
jgi:hypothetical protein